MSILRLEKKLFTCKFSNYSMTDFNAIMLAQITDLQMRVSKQDTVITALKAEVDRLTGSTNSMIRIAPQSTQWVPPGLRNAPSTPNAPTNKKMPDTPVKGPNLRTKPKVSIPYPTMSISDVLNTDETVYMEIRNGKDSMTTAVCNFDGTDLTVLEAELAESIIGLKSSKPGEILYKFMEALHTAGHINKTFGIAPWKLCFVKRDGVKKSLEELR